jgi:hypothetical protein
MAEFNGRKKFFCHQYCRARYWDGWCNANFLWLQNEISFDKFRKNKNNLYEVYCLTGNTDEHPRAINATSQPLASALKQDYAEVGNTTRVTDKNGFLLCSK